MGAANLRLNFRSARARKGMEFDMSGRDRRAGASFAIRGAACPASSLAAAIGPRAIRSNRSCPSGPALVADLASPYDRDPEDDR